MHIITHEFEKILCIIFKSRNCDHLTPKIGDLTPYEDQFPKIIFTCIKIYHHHVNHHCWNVQIGFCISTLAPLCWRYSLSLLQTKLSGYSIKSTKKCLSSMSSLKWKNSTGCKKNYKRRSLLLRNGVHLILGYYIRKNLDGLRLFFFARKHSAPCFSWAFYYLGHCLVANWVEQNLTRCHPFTVWKLGEFSHTFLAKISWK